MGKSDDNFKNWAVLCPGCEGELEVNHLIGGLSCEKCGKEFELSLVDVTDMLPEEDEMGGIELYESYPARFQLA